MTRLGRLALLFALVTTGFSTVMAVTAGSANAAIDTATAEQRFYELLNGARTARGLGALQVDAGVAAVAVDWSGRMAADNSLHHRPDLVAAISAVEANWQGAGENVGVSNDPGIGTVTIVETLHNKFMNSPEHFANIVGDYNRVGIGVVLWDVIRSFQYRQTCAVMIIIIITVSLIDLVSARVRKRLV